LRIGPLLSGLFFTQIAFLPLSELASVARISVDEVRARLTESGLNPTSDEQSIKDLVGHNLRKQVAALNAIFPEDSEE